MEFTVTLKKTKELECTVDGIEAADMEEAKAKAISYVEGNVYEKEWDVVDETPPEAVNVVGSSASVEESVEDTAPDGQGEEAETSTDSGADSTVGNIMQMLSRKYQ